MRHTIMFSVLLSLYGFAGAVAADSRSAVIQPNAEAQAQIERGYHMSVTTEEAWEWFRDLQAAVGYDRIELLRQLAYSWSTFPPIGDPLGTSAILDALGCTREETAEALLESLGSSNLGIRAFAYLAFDTAYWTGEGKAGSFQHFTRTEKPLNFSFYREVIERDKGRPHFGLIRYMYFVSPKDAADTLVTVYKPEMAEAAASRIRVVTDLERQLVWGHIPDEEARTLIKTLNVRLQELAASTEWWEQWFVVECLQDQLMYGDRKLLRIVKKHAHPLVKRRLKEPRDPFRARYEHSNEKIRRETADTPGHRSGSATSRHSRVYGGRGRERVIVRNTCSIVRPNQVLQATA